AIQPFISGAISKTNNLPESATVKEIYDGFLLGYDLGLKAVAVFRDNSKPTQAVGFGDKNLKVFGRGEKEDLPPGRNAFEREVKINDVPLHVIVSEYPDGRPGQIALLAYKSGSTLKALLEIEGISASTALKRGVSLEDYVGKWVGQSFEPHGLVTGHPYIKTAASPLDFAGKFLMLEYLGDTSMAQEPDKVNLSELRGATHGAFRAYRKMEVDEWDVDQVLKDPELGGFEEFKNEKDLTSILKNNSNSNKNTRGVTCGICGNIMIQTAPGCFSCRNCGEGVGGCGM
ncbi:MAG: hypothetical protein IIA85_03585, partial [Nanoarchaeota archaeon]|nr:hypothetical protein [Nanoarchaeota archaeon]